MTRHHEMSLSFFRFFRLRNWMTQCNETKADLWVRLRVSSSTHFLLHFFFWQITVMTVYDDRRRLTDITVEISSHKILIEPTNDSSGKDRASSVGRNLKLQKTVNESLARFQILLWWDAQKNLLGLRHFVLTRYEKFNWKRRLSSDISSSAVRSFHSSNKSS